MFSSVNSSKFIQSVINLLLICLNLIRESISQSAHEIFGIGFNFSVIHHLKCKSSQLDKVLHNILVGVSYSCFQCIQECIQNTGVYFGIHVVTDNRDYCLSSFFPLLPITVVKFWN